MINDVALDDTKYCQLLEVAIGKFADQKERIFSRPEDWERHLQALDLTDLDVILDPVLIASEDALLGATAIRVCRRTPSSFPMTSASFASASCAALGSR